MTVFVNTWDETIPPGTESISLGDNRIREFKYAIRERLAEEHYFYQDETGHSDVGLHKKITLLELAADPTVLANSAILYTKETATKAEIWNMFETNNAYQWSYLGKLWINALNVSGQINKDLIRFNGTIWDRYAWATYIADLIADADFLAWAASYKNAGDIVQVVNYQTGAVATGSTVIPNDDTIPQKTEGDQYMSLTITPTSATNKLKIDVNFFIATSAASLAVAALFQDDTANALAAWCAWPAGSNDQECAGFSYYMDAGTTLATTFKVRIGPVNSETLTFNGVSGARKYGGVIPSSITITEIKV